MFKDFLEKFQSTPKEYIGISLNANGLLEFMQTDRHDGIIKKYTNRTIPYNAISREIESYEEFRAAVEQAFIELNISKKSNVVLSMPNILMGVIELPLILADDAVNNAIISEVEQSYMFKRVDPVVSWTELVSLEERDSRRILYSAIQSSAIVELKSIFEELDYRLVSIQNSNITMFQGLEFCKVTEDFVNSKAPWNLIVISQSNYSIYASLGNKIVEYFEEPLAIKSFPEDEVYAAISMLASNALKNFPAENNLVISETDEISAEVISKQLGLMGIPRSLEQNKFQDQPPIDIDFNVLPNYVRQITISSIGTSIDFFDDSPLKINYLLTTGEKADFMSGDVINVFGIDIELTKESVMTLTVAVCILLFFFFALIYFGFQMWNNGLTKTLSSIEQDEQRLKSELNESNNKSGSADIYTVMNEISRGNRSVMLYYDSLSYALPNQMWIQYFYADSSGAVSINGVSMSPQDITNFLKGIRDITGETNLSVSKLKIEGADSEEIMMSSPELYSFQLSTPAFQPAQSSGSDDPNKSKQNPQQPSTGASSVPVPPSSAPPANQPSVAPPVLPTPTN